MKSVDFRGNRLCQKGQRAPPCVRVRDFNMISHPQLDLSVQLVSLEKRGDGFELKSALRSNVGWTYREGNYLKWNVALSPSTGLGEQRASPGPQAREEGPEGQSDPGRPPGAVLQHLAAFFHHQHGAGQKGQSERP